MDLVELTFDEVILSRSLLADLAAALDEVAETAAGSPLVIGSRHPTVFLAGAHLGEIADLDGIRSAGYGHDGRAVLARLRRHPAATVAAVHGTCAGGGFDLVLECDQVVASPTASFRHPGVYRGLVTGWGGSVTLPVVAGAASTPVMIAGREISAPQAVALGIASSIDSDPRSAARRLARRLASLHPDRLAAWRCLQTGNFVDTFRATVVHHQSRMSCSKRGGHRMGRRETR